VLHALDLAPRDVGRDLGTSRRLISADDVMLGAFSSRRGRLEVSAASEEMVGELVEIR
jgi:hypothetical protein